MPSRTFSLDPNRLDRYRREADKARGEARIAQDRVQGAQFELHNAKDELLRIEGSLAGEPRLITVRGGEGRGDVRHAKSEHQLRIEGARNRVERARAELKRLTDATNDGAGIRDNTLKLFSRISGHAKGYAR